jgi:hypothetical protein
MLNFLVQTLYSAIFSLPKASYTKKPQAKGKKSHIPKQKPKAKAPLPPSGGLLHPVINRVEQEFMRKGTTS